MTFFKKYFCHFLMDYSINFKEKYLTRLITTNTSFLHVCIFKITDSRAALAAIIVYILKYAFANVCEGRKSIQYTLVVRPTMQCVRNTECKLLRAPVTEPNQTYR